MPERLFGRYLERLLALGRSVLMVRQGQQQWTGVRERLLAWRVIGIGLTTGRVAVKLRLIP
jgi:hypothetical protein